MRSCLESVTRSAIDADLATPLAADLRRPTNQSRENAKTRSRITIRPTLHCIKRAKPCHVSTWRLSSWSMAIAIPPRQIDLIDTYTASVAVGKSLVGRTGGIRSRRSLRRWVEQCSRDYACVANENLAFLKLDASFTQEPQRERI